MAVEARDPVTMRGDADLMREAISNLLDNAIKFTPEGGKVRVEARTVEGFPRLAISDTGRGVPPEDRGPNFPTLLSRRRAHRTFRATDLASASPRPSPTCTDFSWT